MPVQHPVKRLAQLGMWRVTYIFPAAPCYSRLPPDCSYGPTVTIFEGDGTPELLIKKSM